MFEPFVLKYEDDTGVYTVSENGDSYSAYLNNNSSIKGFGTSPRQAILNVKRAYGDLIALKQDDLNSNNLHDQAMLLADEADIAKRKGFLDVARVLYKLAYGVEKAVADQVIVEPSRSIIYRSLAALALEAELFQEAKDAISWGFGENPPQEIVDEYRDLLNTHLDRMWVKRDKSDQDLI